MKTSKIKIHEALSLAAEVNGFQQGEKIVFVGLLNEKLPIKIKYWLGRLNTKLEDNKQAVEKLRIELVEKFGEKAKDGSINVPYQIDEVINPKFLDFQKEYNELLQEDFEFEHPEFFLTDFENLETESNYQMFFKLIED